MLSNTLTPRNFNELWKPNYPFATDNFTYGMNRMPREKAIGKKYIETSPSKMRNLIVIDVDVEDSVRHLQGLILDDESIPEPSFITVNPVSSHAHVGYFIDGFASSDKARDFMADIAGNLSLLSSGDPAYGGRTMRNPLHDGQSTIWGTDHLYSFKELEAYKTEQSSTAYAKKELNEKAENGRNDALFNSLRTWGYRARLSYENLNDWDLACFERARELNFSLDTPLPANELNAIAKSVSSFIWKKFSKEQFSAIQSARRKRSPIVKEAQAKAESIMFMVEEGFTITEVAASLNISYSAAKMAIRRAKARVQ